MKSASVRSALRSQIRELAGDGCEWPQCSHRGVEMAHLRSIGMGGRPSADVLSNVAWLCAPHALMSDGKQPSQWPDGTPCGWPGFVQAHTALFGDNWQWRIPKSRWGFERAEALKAHVAAKRAQLGVE